MSVLVTLAIVLFVLFTAGAVYDRVARLKRAVRSTWRQLEQQRGRRHAIVERITAALPAQGVDAHGVDAVVAARQNAATAAGPADAARKEGALGETLSALLTASAIAMSADVAVLARELGDVERAYREARVLYNSTARRYNTALSVVPGSIVARAGRFPRAELFE